MTIASKMSRGPMEIATSRVELLRPYVPRLLISWLRETPGARHLGTINVPEIPANLAFGDADKKTLYIAARTSIYKIRLNTPGI